MPIGPAPTTATRGVVVSEGRLMEESLGGSMACGARFGPRRPAILRESEAVHVLFLEAEVVAVFVEEGDPNLLRHLRARLPGPLEVSLEEEHDVREPRGGADLVADRGPHEEAQDLGGDVGRLVGHFRRRLRLDRDGDLRDDVPYLLREAA